MHISEQSTASMTSSPELNAIKTQIGDNVSVRDVPSVTQHKININPQNTLNQEEKDNCEEGSDGNSQGKRGRNKNNQQSTGIIDVFLNSFSKQIPQRNRTKSQNWQQFKDWTLVQGRAHQVSGSPEAIWQRMAKSTVACWHQN